MRSLFILPFTAALVTAQYAQFECNSPSIAAYIKQEDDYIHSIHHLKHSSGSLDLIAPWNEIAAITYRRIFGVTGLDAILSGSRSSLLNKQGISSSSNTSQQVSDCQGQFFDQLQDCAACHKAHGANDWVSSYVPTTVMQDSSSSYYALPMGSSPSLGFTLAGFNALAAWAGNQTSVRAPFSDSTGSSMAMSLYYTPKFISSAARPPARASESVGGTTSTETNQTGNVATTNGHIETPPPSHNPVSATTSASKASSGTGRQEMAAFAGIIALAGSVMLL